jgi:hypothetical protein
MAYNDFSSVQAVLSDQFVLERPQSNERVRGAEKYVQMNAEYPARALELYAKPSGRHDNSREAVSDVGISRGGQTVRVLPAHYPAFGAWSVSIFK